MSLGLRGLSVRYGSTVAVAEAELTIADGEVVALLGPSGCGKSTLLRAVAGLEHPAAGTVCWDDDDLAAVPVHRRGFGLVFQDGQLFPHRDVAGNVAFGLRMAGIDRAAAAERVTELLGMVGLAGYESRSVTSLSGGEQQRVALARALAPRPRLLLLDEPLSALDRVLREQLAIDLAALLRTTRTTTLVVTHDHDEAFTLADRVAVMTQGRLRQIGPPDEVWRLPASPEVAAFLGCTTLLPAEVAGGVARCVLGSVPLRAGTAGPDGRVLLGLRSTALAVDPAGELTGTVVQRVHRRDHVRLLVEVPAAGGGGVAGIGDAAGSGGDAGVGGGGRVEAVAQVADAPAPGDPVRLALRADGVAVVG
ncbi:thiamine transport system ATP-binding protein [Actinoalloteichus hoggarensis]|uniref:ABC-type quaternary amine transporter n=1 Tax=Actinoalloteichus hoggarensis TaxID=1470176 RepID=A0A221VY45_9PSEU|nr:ABC transporter ATP-binding protein [Actinoalloteichus hoggarensis]ASO18489.1 Spermidine/putrescine import ATP-binding protein PotA [Actinoalloteichus hoggarensis]MBB5921857.1 thiamine transport system ATP-binding protein [Actinoalloteichus hoggarensis]